MQSGTITAIRQHPATVPFARALNRTSLTSVIYLVITSVITFNFKLSE